MNGGGTVWLPETGFPTVRTDMLKIRTSDNTLAAATYGRGVWTAVIPSTPEIRFTGSLISATENSAITSGCRSYKEYALNVSSVSSPTGDATVTYSINGGNTATQGADFDFTTNGNFASPSNQHTFNSGIAQTKTVTVRIYDDADVESLETFTLQLAVTGTTDAFAGNFKTYSFRISDNDVAPAAISSSVRSLYNPVLTFGSISASPMFDARLQRKKSVVLYKASELTAAGVVKGLITSVAFNLQKSSTRAYQNLQIKARLLYLSYLVDNGSSFSFTNTTVKSLASYNTIHGWNTFNFDTPFAWDGISNILFEVCYDNLTADNSDLADVILGSNDPQAGMTQGNFYHQSNISCANSFSSVSYFFNGAKPAIQIGNTNNGVTIENTLNASRSEYVGPNGDAYFYSNTGVILARVRNLTSFDYGCTQVVIDRAGNGSSPFWNNNSANYLTNKSFRIIPTTNNSSGMYEVTLYFTAAEKAGWEAATGQSWNSIQLIKVAGKISDVTRKSKRRRIR